MMQLKNLLSRLRHIDKYTLTMWGWAAIAVFSQSIVVVQYMRGGFDLDTMILAFLAGQSVGGIFVTYLLKLMRERLVIMVNMQGALDVQQNLIYQQQQIIDQQHRSLFGHDDAPTVPDERRQN
jgi:hypothetical protein